MGLSEEGVRAFVTIITMFENKRYAQMYFYLKQIRDELMHDDPTLYKEMLEELDYDVREY